MALVEGLLRRLTAVEGRVAALEDRLALDSHNSSKPPSSDLGRPKPAPRSLRPAPGTTGRTPGGQPGHPGATLRLVDTPDRLALHRPAQCAACGRAWPPGRGGSGWTASGGRCSSCPPGWRWSSTGWCGSRARPSAPRRRGAFPAGVAQPVQYGDRLKAVGVYLHDYQLLPYARTQELLADLFGAAPAEGTLQAAEAAWRRPRRAGGGDRAGAPGGRLAGFDETGVQVAGRREWLHVACTTALTHYGVHPKRGRRATDAVGILPAFTGTAVHDAYPSYLSYRAAPTPCATRTCSGADLPPRAAPPGVGRRAGHPAGDGQGPRRRGARRRAGPRGPRHAGDHRRPLRPPPLAGPGANPSTAPPAGPPGSRPPAPDQGAEPARPADDLPRRGARLPLRPARALRQQPGRARPAHAQGPAEDQRRLPHGHGPAAFARIRGYVSTLRKQGLPVLAALESVFAGSP